MASAALQSALAERWRSQKPDNTWAARRSGAIPEKEASAWDTFDAREPVVGRAASEVCEETTSQKKKDKKAKRKAKELWIEPKALNAAGFAIGKRHIVGGSGDFVRSAHGERRDRKRAAKREEREAKRAAKRQRLEEPTASGGDCDANADGTAAPAAASASAGAPATAAPSTSSVVVIDPFHGRLVAASAPAPARPSSKVGSKRRKRRKRLEEARQAASGVDLVGASGTAEAGAPKTTTATTTAAAADAPANEPNAVKANEPVDVRAADRSSFREAAAAKRVACGEDSRWDSSHSRWDSSHSRWDSSHSRWDSSRNSSREHRPPRKQFPYGNYDAYYGYRYVGGGGSGGGGGGSGSGSCGGGGAAHHGALDPRLVAIDPSWLRDKDCLDIGCNAGQFTASLASRFGVRSMLGIDIDATLVTRAQRLLRHVAPLVGPPQNPTALAAPPMPPVAAAAAAAAAAATAAAASSRLATAAAATNDARAPVAAAPLPDPAAGNLSNDDFRRLLQLPPRSVPDTAPVTAAPSPAAPAAPAAAAATPSFSQLPTAAAPSFPISFPTLYGGRPASAVAGASAASAVAGASAASAPSAPSSIASAAPSAAPSPSAFPHNTRFVHMNFVEEPPAAGQLGVGPATLAARFDVVCCFSTSKWIHLNWGDEGLQRLFVRAHACLRPGGLFLLEPQPWSSYRKRAGLTPLIKRNYGTIRLRPEGFCAYLTSEAVGFASARPIEVAYGEEVGDNFRRRPLIVCEKRGGGAEK
jgi:hypothetical protein